jgi:6-phosphogluconolactonase
VPEIIVLGDAAAVAREAAKRFTAQASEAVDARGRFSVALSGGSTPGALYRQLAAETNREQLPWQEIHFFWSDERCVPPGDPGSNYRLADEALISHLDIPPENVHRVHGELKPEAAARAYEHVLQDYFCGTRTRFDLVLLGLGSDGHTASLFPGSPALDETLRLATAATATYEGRPAQRVTLTLPSINSAREVLFLVTGSAKADIVHAVLEDTEGDYPAQRIQPVAGRLLWLLDSEAGRKLGK